MRARTRRVMGARTRHLMESIGLGLTQAKRALDKKEALDRKRALNDAIPKRAKRSPVNTRHLRQSVGLALTNWKRALDNAALRKVDVVAVDAREKFFGNAWELIDVLNELRKAKKQGLWSEVEKNLKNSTESELATRIKEWEKKLDEISSAILPAKNLLRRKELRNFVYIERKKLAMIEELMKTEGLMNEKLRQLVREIKALEKENAKLAKQRRKR